MLEEDILIRCRDVYPCLVHPIRADDAYRRELAPLLQLTPSVSDAVVCKLITGPSWRERLLGLCLAIAKQPTSRFIHPMIESLEMPRGIAIVPTCAAIAVLAQSGVFKMSRTFGDLLDRTAFDGEVGWAIDKAMYAAGVCEHDAAGVGPNFGQVFGDHVEVYRWVAQAAKT